MDTVHEIGQGANPQAENGHIDIANEIAEALAKTNLSYYESRILWVIWRKTYGWHKKMDQISFTQFEEATGVHRRNIQRTLQRLEERKIIVVSRDYGRIVRYGFQKDYTKWKNVVSRNYDVGKSRLGGQGRKKETGRSLSPETTDRSLQRLTQKKLTKENTYNGRSPKKETDPRVKEFLKYWEETFLQETGSPYTASFGKDGKLIKALLKIHPLETLKQLTRNFFRDRNVREQVQQGRIGYTIGVFFKEVNRLVSLKGMDPLEYAKRELYRARRKEDQKLEDV